MSSNLPPGVTDSMIPGNRPEDRALESLYEKVCEILDTVDDAKLDAVVKLCGDCYAEGYAAGQRDEAMAKIIGEEDVEK